MSVEQELFDRRVANDFRSVDALKTPEDHPISDVGYKFAERFIPYSGESSNYFHWFMRF